MKKYFVFCIAVWFSQHFLMAQSHVPKYLSPSTLLSSDSLAPSSKRLKTLIIGGSAVYGTTLAGLYFLWYKEGLEPRFRFSDDNADWLQMDKVGHFYSAFHFSQASGEAFQWAGLKEKKAMFWGAVLGTGLMLPIEIFDGFSEEYGASWGDLLANTAGAGFLYGQHLLWNEVRIHPKFSFHRTSFAPRRPELLGSALHEEIIKDYNGQTYWLSVDVAKFLPESRYPKWLNWAVGYGIEGMTYANLHENRTLGGNMAYRQYFLSPDWNLMAIPAKRKFFKVLRFVANLIKLPAPALEYNAQGGFRFHFLYF